VCLLGNSISSKTGYILLRFWASRWPAIHIRTNTEDMNMKKLVLALTALAALTGSAMAADLAPRPYAKAPMPMPVAPSWTGFYISGGFGGGLWAADNGTFATATGVPLGTGTRSGGSGWYGTVGAGYDWQVNQSWVIGILADGQFGSIRGNVSDTFFNLTGSETLRTSYAGGGRVGYLVARMSFPTSMPVIAARSGPARRSRARLLAAQRSPRRRVSIRNGWFVGGGVENNLDIFGIHIPGLFMKTEYRAAYYGNVNLPENCHRDRFAGDRHYPDLQVLE